MKVTNPKKKDAFLNSIPIVSIESQDDTLTLRCKFNLSYMDFSQPAGQCFEDWDQKQLSQLLIKLHLYSKESLQYWGNKRIGAKNNKVLEIYGNFPHNSAFKHPKHVPHQALWARFRLESSVRVIGFILPEKYHQHKHLHTGLYFDCNTFYVVFLDKNHQFYITEK